MEQETYIPKNEEIIRGLELFKGRQITLIKRSETKEEKENPITISGILKENMKMDLPVMLEGGRGINEIKNIKRENGKYFIQTPDAVYELKIG